MPASMHAFTPTVVLALGRQGCGCLCAGLQQPQWQHRGGGRVAGVCVCICASDGVGGGMGPCTHSHWWQCQQEWRWGCWCPCTLSQQKWQHQGEAGPHVALMPAAAVGYVHIRAIGGEEARSTHTCALAKWWWGGHGQVHAGKVELGRLWSGEAAGGLMHDSRSCSAGALQWSSAISQQSSYGMVPEEAPWLGI